jgi:hypothetical protein
MKTRPRLLRLINLRSQWLFTEIGSFFNELELWRKNFAHTFLFFNEHKFCGKTARFMVKFNFLLLLAFLFSNVVLHLQLLQQILLEMDNICMKTRL